MMWRKGSQRGTSLIELTVALVIFAVAGVAVMANISSILFLFGDAGDRNEFVWQARSCAEEILQEEGDGFDISANCHDGKVNNLDKWPKRCDSEKLEVQCEREPSNEYCQVELHATQLDRDPPPIVLQIPY